LAWVDSLQGSSAYALAHLPTGAAALHHHDNKTMNYEEAAACGYAWSNDQGESKIEEEKRLAEFHRFKFRQPPSDCAPRQKDGTPTFN